MRREKGDNMLGRALALVGLIGFLFYCTHNAQVKSFEEKFSQNSKKQAAMVKHIFADKTPEKAAPPNLPQTSYVPVSFFRSQVSAQPTASHASQIDNDQVFLRPDEDMTGLTDEQRLEKKYPGLVDKTR